MVGARSRRLASVSGNSLTSLTGSEYFPAFSPDGKQVAFTWNGGESENLDIWVNMAGDERPSRLTSDPARDWFPAWSPDGRQIAFSRMGDLGGIYVVSPLGGPERRLAGLVANGRPCRSVDGKFLLVAQRYEEGRPELGNGALFLVPVASGGDPRQILAPPHGTWYRDPAYARDGRSLAFVSCIGSARDRPMCTLQVAGLKVGLVPYGQPRPIQQYSRPFGVAWTADGSTLIYGSDGYLWRAGVRSGKAAERLELAGSSAFDPALDFNTGRLAFSRSISNIDIWRLDSGGTASPILTSIKPPRCRSSIFSGRPAHRLLVWPWRRQRRDMDRKRRRDGSEPSYQDRGVPQSGTPRWSPDGKWIAFEASGKAGGWDVWVAEASGGPRGS